MDRSLPVGLLPAARLAGLEAALPAGVVQVISSVSALSTPSGPKHTVAKPLQHDDHEVRLPV